MTRVFVGGGAWGAVIAIAGVCLAGYPNQAARNAAQIERFLIRVQIPSGRLIARHEPFGQWVERLFMGGERIPPIMPSPVYPVHQILNRLHHGVWAVDVECGVRGVF